MLRVQSDGIDFQTESYFMKLEEKSPLKIARIREGDAICDSLIRQNNIFTIAMQNYKEAYLISLSKDREEITKLKSQWQWQWKPWVYAYKGFWTGVLNQWVKNYSPYCNGGASIPYSLIFPRTWQVVERVMKQCTPYPEIAPCMCDTLLSMASARYGFPFAAIIGVLEGAASGVEEKEREALICGSKNKREFFSFFENEETKRIEQLSQTIFNRLTVLFLDRKTNQEIIEISQLYSVFDGLATEFDGLATDKKLFVKEDGTLVMKTVKDPEDLPFREYLESLSSLIE